MRHATTSWRWILPLVAAVATASGIATATDDVGDIALEQLDARSIVALEHQGPYWTVRRRLSEVVAYMRKRGHSGPLLIRYGADPTGPHAASLSSLVGVITDGDFQPEAPFQRVELPAETVVTETVAPGSAVSPRKFKELVLWAKEHGYEPTGPMAELYYNTVNVADSPASPRKVVLQIVVRPAPAVHQPVAGTRDTAKASGPKPATPRAPEASGKATETVKPPEPAEQDTIPWEPVVPEPAAAAPATRHPVAQTPKPTHAPPKQPATTPAPRHPVAQSSKPEPPPTASPPPKPAARPDDGTKSIKQLLEMGQGDAVVDRILPAGRPIPPGVELWLGQVVFRVKAAAKGVERIHPGQGATLQQFSEALQRRFDAVAKPHAPGSVEQSVVRVDPEHRTQATKRQRALLMDLDRLLARIAFQSVPPADVVSDLGTLLAKVDQEVDSWYGQAEASPN